MLEGECKIPGIGHISAPIPIVLHRRVVPAGEDSVGDSTTMSEHKRDAAQASIYDAEAYRNGEEEDEDQVSQGHQYSHSGEGGSGMNDYGDE